MLFILLLLCLNECSLQHTKNAMRKMPDTYINSQPKPSCSVITLSTKVNLTWASAVTQYDNLVTDQGYQKSHRIGNRQEAMVELCLSPENRRHFQTKKKKKPFHCQFVHHGRHMSPGDEPSLRANRTASKARATVCQNFIGVSF